MLGKGLKAKSPTSAGFLYQILRIIDQFAFSTLPEPVIFVSTDGSPLYRMLPDPLIFAVKTSETEILKSPDPEIVMSAFFELRP